MIGRPLTPQTPEWAALVRALEDHPSTPCAGSDDWTHDEPGPRMAAALACRACPLAQACHDAAESTGEAHGVWAGIDRTPAPKPKRERKTA